MSCIRFKLKSSLEYDKVTFDGLQISVGDLRKKIMAQKKLGMSDNFTLQIMDAQSKKIYSSESEMVPRNTSVIIMRVPVVSAHKNPKIQTRDISVPKDNGFSLDNLRKTGDLAGADATEEEKVLAMMSQAGEDYNQANYAKFKPRSSTYAPNLVKQPPPPNYVCHRCGQKGHWIKFCPTNGDPNFDNPRIKPPSGIPKSHVVHVTSNTAGAMKDRQGNLVKRKVDMLTDGSSKPKSLDDLDTSVPPELTCSICKELIKDAVIIPCCGESFCDECIREYLLENEFKCFACEETDVSPDTLVPNKRLRNDAKKFQSGLTQRKRLAVTRGLPGFVVNEQTPPTLPKPVVVEDDLTTPLDLSLDPPSTDVKSPINPSLSPAPSSADVALPISPKNSEDKEQKLPSNDRDTPTPPTPPLPPLTTNKPQISMATKVQITQPISLYSNSRPLQSTANFSVPPGLLTTPIIPNPMGIPPTATHLIQSSIFPQSAAIAHGGGLIPGIVPQLSLTVPTQVVRTPVLPSAVGSAQSNASSLLLQAAALNNNSSGSSGSNSLDPNQMARLAELLVAAEARKKSPSPAPLSFEEFQRQQKVLRGLDIPIWKPPRADSHSDSYSSQSYSSRSSTPTRKGRGRSYSLSPDPYDQKRSHHSGSSRSKRHRHDYSPSEEKTRKKHKHKSNSEQSNSKKSNKRKHHGKGDDYLSPQEDEGAEFQENKAKRHKRKKHRHSKKYVDDVPGDNGGKAEAVVLPPNDDEAVEIDSSSIVTDNGENMITDPTISIIDHTPNIDHTSNTETKNSESTCSSEEKVSLNKVNSDGDADTASGGSTPVLLPPHQESLGPPSALSEDPTSPLSKPLKKSKHKHRSRKSSEEKERKKHHRKLKKHHKHRVNGSGFEKKKKGHKNKI